MESNVRTLASNLGRFFRPSEALFVPMKHPRVALRAPLVRFMGTKYASSVQGGIKGEGAFTSSRPAQLFLTASSPKFEIPEV